MFTKAKVDLSAVVELRRRRRAAGDRRDRAAALAPQLPAHLRASRSAARRRRRPGCPAPRSPRTSKGDVAILNFALTLEYLESAFYASALKHAGLTGELERFARHRPRPREGARRGAAQGARLRRRQAADVRVRRRGHEQGGVRRDRDQARGHRRAGLPGPGAVHQLPGRVQGRDLDPPGRGPPRRLDPQPRRGYAPAPAAFNPALTKSAVLAAVGATGFIKSELNAEHRTHGV